MKILAEQFLIGIDCGTTSVKALLYNAAGVEMFQATKENQVIAQGLNSEQDMELLWQNVKGIIKELVQTSGILPAQVAGIGVSGQGEGLWAVDHAGKPVRNAILWNDMRANRLVDQIKAQGDLHARIKRIVASYIKAGSTLTLLRWLKEMEVENYARTTAVFSCKDWIRFRLTGKIAWEVTEATCSCVNLSTRQYAEDVFAWLDMPEVIDKLPPLISGYDKAGGLLADVAADIGLLPQTPVAGGLLDLMSTVVGLGAMGVGDTCIIVGTTGMTLRVHDSYAGDDLINGWGLHIDGKNYIKGVGSMAATPNLDWAIAQLFGTAPRDEVYARIEAEIGERKPFAHGLLYHPHISPAGERAPFFNPAATAGLLGIRQNTTKIDIIHAIMEGIALSARDCLSAAGSIEQVFLSGGGAKNIAWAQIYADVLNADVYITTANEPSAKGAAICAGLMCGMIDSMDKVKDNFLTIKTSVQPRAENVGIYDELYKMYKQTQAAMEPFWTWRIEQVIG